MEPHTGSSSSFMDFDMSEPLVQDPNQVSFVPPVQPEVLDFSTKANSASTDDCTFGDFQMASSKPGFGIMDADLFNPFDNQAQNSSIGLMELDDNGSEITASMTMSPVSSDKFSTSQTEWIPDPLPSVDEDQIASAIPRAPMVAATNMLMASAAFTSPSAIQQSSSAVAGAKRKRKRSSDDATAKRKRHNETEIRRRRKMKATFSELQSVLECKQSSKNAILECAISSVNSLKQQVSTLTNRCAQQTSNTKFVILRGSPVPSVVCKLDGRILDCNKAFANAVAKPVVQLREDGHMLQLALPEALPAFFSVMNSLLKGEVETADCPYKLLQDNTIVEYRCTAWLVEDENNEKYMQCMLIKVASHRAMAQPQPMELS